MAMRILTFSGSSDDIFCFEEKRGGDETYAGSDDIAAYKVANDHGGLIVVGAYSPKLAGNGCWAVGVTLLDEDIKLPDWPMRFGSAQNGYSALLTIETPDDVRVTPLHRGEKE